MRFETILRSILVVLFCAILVEYLSLNSISRKQDSLIDKPAGEVSNKISDLISNLPAQPGFEPGMLSGTQLQKIKKDPFYQLPASLQDVPLTYQFQLAADGNLLLTSDIKEIFDYFLSGIAEEPLDVSVARILSYTKATLDQAAEQHAQELLLSYLTMKVRMQELDEGFKGSENMDMKSFLIARNMLMRDALGDELYDVFYSDAHQYDNFTLAKQALVADSDSGGLTPGDSTPLPSLSEKQKNYRSKAVLHQSLRSDVERLRAEGESKEKIFELRAQRVGKEAAQRLAQLDLQREKWNHRVEAFRNSLQEISLDESLSATKKKSMVDDLRNRKFNDAEQIRLNYWLAEP